MIRGNIIGKQNAPTTSVASGIWSLQDQYLSKRKGIWPTPEPIQLTSITYSQSSLYGSNAAANYAGMNDNNANGSVSTNGYQTGTNAETNAFIKADLGSTKYVDRIVIGYDYLSNLPGGWGTSYAEGRIVQGSTDNTNWTTITTTPTYASTGSTNGLVSINVKNYWRYIRLYNASGYVMTLEFQVWGS